MNILVTGAKGFIGRNLVSQLHNIQSGKARNYPVSGTELKVFEYDMDSDPAELDVYCKKADFVFGGGTLPAGIDGSKHLVQQDQRAVAMNGTIGE